MANNPFGNMPGGMGGLMKQAQKMMADAQKAEEELSNVVVEAAPGGGAVKATANGKGEITAIKIAKEAVDPDDVEMLEDLVLTAVREAISKSNAMRTDRLSNIVPSGMNLPGLF